MKKTGPDRRYHMRFYLYLLWKHLWQYPGRAFAALLVLLVASLWIQALANVGVALRFRLAAHLEQVFPEERLELEAVRMNVGPMALEGRPITGKTLQAVKERQEVENVWPVEPIRFPIRAEGDVFGQYISTDAVAQGVPRPLVADALEPDQSWQAPPEEDDVYPVVVSRYFLDLYNLGLARANNLPLLSPNAVVGRQFTLVLGESTVGLFRSDVPVREIQCKVVGLTSQQAMLGIALPPDVVQAFNRRYMPSLEPTFVKLVVLLRRGALRERFLEGVQPLGLTLSGSDVLVGQVKTVVHGASWVMIILASGVFALGSLMFYLLFAMIFHARRLDLVRLRAMGMSPGGVLALALGEVSVLAAIAVGLAAFVNIRLFAWIEEAITPWLGHLSWVPEGVFRPDIGWFGLISAILFMATIIPALPMLFQVVRGETGQMIRDL